MALANFLERAPNPLLSRLLLTMDFATSLQFLHTNRTLRSLSTSIALPSYRTALLTDGLLDNPLCPLPTFAKHRLLLARRAAWARLRPAHTDLRDLPWTPNASLRRVACSPNMFVCFGNKEARLTAFGVMGVRMPYALPEEEEGARARAGTTGVAVDARRRARDAVFFDCPEKVNEMLIGLGASIEEYDLVIFARMFKAENDPKYSISLQFRPNFTDSFTNIPRTSELPLFHKEIAWSSGKPKPRVELLSAGGYVLLTTENHGGNEGRANSVLLSLFDMNTKKFIMDDTWVDSSGFAFIDKHVFINPNLKYGGLDVYHIRPAHPSSTLQTERVTMVLRFGLPALEPGMEFVSMSCRCSPGTTTTEYRRLGPRVPFYDDPAAALLHLEMRVRRAVKSEDGDDLPPQDFVVLVHRRALLTLVQQFQAKATAKAPDLAAHGMHLTIPYGEWGPAATRWFRRDVTPGGRTAYSYGQRFVETTHTIGAGFPRNESEVRVMDFNPAAVQEALRRRGGSKDPMRLAPEGALTSVRYAERGRLDWKNLVVRVDAFGQLGMFEGKTDVQEDPGDVLECRGYFKENIVNRLPYVLFVGGEEWSSLNIYDVFIDGPRLLIVVFDANYKRYIRVAFLG